MRKRCSVVFGVTFRLLVINISRYQHRSLLPAIGVTTCGRVVRRRRIDNIWLVAALTARSEARYRLRISISAYPTCIRRPVKGLPVLFDVDGEKNWKIHGMFICFDRMYERDRQTHRQTDTRTPHDG